MRTDAGVSGSIIVFRSVVAAAEGDGAQRAERWALLWLEARAVSYGQAVRYYSWKQILHQSLDVLDDAPPAYIREELRSTCAERALPDEDMHFLEALLR